jgi:hypothetical protein
MEYKNKPHSFQTMAKNGERELNALTCLVFVRLLLCSSLVLLGENGSLELCSRKNEGVTLNIERNE